ncbi:MAG: T9SS type A sorting domain-containing protein [Bacteroidia bacterium]
MKKIITTFIMLTLFGLSSNAQNKKEIKAIPNSNNNKLLHLNVPTDNEGTETEFLTPKKIPITLRGVRPLIALRDSIYNWKWDTISNAWNSHPYLRTAPIAYDANYNLTNKLQQTWNGTVWVNQAQYTYTYDANNSQTTEFNKKWNGTAWENNYQIISNYDANNNLTNYYYQEWKGTNWENTYQFTYGYDANNNWTSLLSQDWKDTAWISTEKDTYTYDGNNNQITSLFQFLKDTTWENSVKSEYMYDSANKLVSSLSYHWDGLTWINKSKVVYTYDANNIMINYLEQVWRGGEWKNNSQTLFNNSNKTFSNYLVQIWTGSGWANQFQLATTEDANGLLTSKVVKNRNNAGSKITKGDSTHYYFHTVTSIKNLAAQKETINVYPNPTKDILTIENTTSNKNSIISIYSIQGQLMIQQPIMQSKTEINVNQLTKGIYILMLNNGEKTSVARFIKE